MGYAGSDGSADAAAAVTAADRGWGPAPTDRSKIVPVTLGRNGVNAAPGVHRLIAPLVVELARRWETITGDMLLDGWCWGYAPRLIRGSTSRWSNHAWGLAVDFNAPRWPLGSMDRPPNADEMRDAAADLGFRWGAYYAGRRDPMHFEQMGSPADVDRYVANLGSTPVKPQEDTMFCRYGDTDSDAVRALQVLLRYAGDDVKAVLTSGEDVDGVDGHYGDLTAKALALAVGKPKPLKRYGPWEYGWLQHHFVARRISRAESAQTTSAGVPPHTHTATVDLE